jgi:uncharacterized protein YecE (DUF72 family)
LEVYVGTSGWLYDWNEAGSFDWYLENSGLNAVELNASFYRFPFRNQVVGWARKTSVKPIRWAVKVHRSITHVHRLREGSYQIWSRFYELFKPLDPYIDFYLFQLPPTFKFSEESVERVKRFAEFSGLSFRMAVEFRDPSWFNRETVDVFRESGLTVVSIDSPIGKWITSSNNIVYLRLHGAAEWYAYEYTDDELKELAEAVLMLKPQKIYVFFNNNHWMLGNARKMLELLVAKQL